MYDHESELQPRPHRAHLEMAVFVPALGTTVMCDVPEGEDWRECLADYLRSWATRILDGIEFQDVGFTAEGLQVSAVERGGRVYLADEDHAAQLVVK